MAADFTIIDNEARDHVASESEATTVAFTPAIGDVAFFTLTNFEDSEADVALTGGGMVWAKLIFEQNVTTWGVLAFRAASGTPSESVLTITAGDSWIDTMYAIVRPVDLTYTGVAGSDDSAGVAVDTLSVTLSTTTPGGLLAYFGNNDDNITWNVNVGNVDWVEIMDQTVASGRSHQLMEKFGDDTDVIGDAASNEEITGVVLEFAAIGGGISIPIVMRNFRQMWQ